MLSSLFKLFLCPFRNWYSIKMEPGRIWPNRFDLLCTILSVQQLATMSITLDWQETHLHRRFSLDNFEQRVNQHVHWTQCNSNLLVALNRFCWVNLLRLHPEQKCVYKRFVYFFLTQRNGNNFYARTDGFSTFNIIFQCVQTVAWNQHA